MKIAVIGGGNMARAILLGLLNAGVSAGDLFVSDIDKSKLSAFSEKGIGTGDNISAAGFGDVLVLAVKPDKVRTVLEQVKSHVRDVLVISIAAGVTISNILDVLGEGARVVRAMPNTPAMVGEGMTAISVAGGMGQEDVKRAEFIFSCTGKCAVVDEKLMDAVVSVSGSSPAYVFMLIEAMAQGAAHLGMPWPDAKTFATQAVLGAAKLALESEMHPAELRDMVCSPGGTTIEAVRVLEDRGFKSAVIEAMEACANKSKKLQT